MRKILKMDPCGLGHHGSEHFALLHTAIVRVKQTVLNRKKGFEHRQKQWLFSRRVIFFGVFRVFWYHVSERTSKFLK